MRVDFSKSPRKLLRVCVQTFGSEHADFWVASWGRLRLPCYFGATRPSWPVSCSAEGDLFDRDAARQRGGVCGEGKRGVRGFSGGEGGDGAGEDAAGVDDGAGDDGGGDGSFRLSRPRPGGGPQGRDLAPRPSTGGAVCRGKGLGIRGWGLVRGCFRLGGVKS